MGKIYCANNAFILEVNALCQCSSVLNAMMQEILEGGDLTIHLTAGQHSFYDNRNIVLGLAQLIHRFDQLSTCIMEICNAWMSVKHEIPEHKAFDTKEAYGAAVEKEEWHAIKKHIKIHKQLASTKMGMGPSRFEVGFTDPRNGWDNFDNYLAQQRASGHTAQIESHWNP